ncbi:acylphosphatase [Gloeothece citriformis PCC 7424]|uniref:acylphosphatase n=1 Tax=Gloeothece citriformis (strain PCC 7424) TaxID=65393 RepID=B7KL70_GLOC7|nr:acylphosphatase [Gloeothece citriformis]ACK72442.1 acylphosphatase [Gloeothece citriformis PCC 7424]
MKLIAAHVLISGKVQGVGYRYSTVHKAKELGLQGWVKNLEDGRVETVFEGSQMAVEQMIQWCHQGPQGAIVSEVRVERVQPEALEGFEIKYS